MSGQQMISRFTKIKRWIKCNIDWIIIFITVMLTLVGGHLWIYFWVLSGYHYVCGRLVDITYMVGFAAGCVFMMVIIVLIDRGGK